GNSLESRQIVCFDDLVFDAWHIQEINSKGGPK
ncbi:MAG: hypothetical protein RLZZ443_135, partial [Actinomycetota bacterium]